MSSNPYDGSRFPTSVLLLLVVVQFPYVRACPCNRSAHIQHSTAVVRSDGHDSHPATGAGMHRGYSPYSATGTGNFGGYNPYLAMGAGMYGGFHPFQAMGLGMRLGYPFFT
ncbi:hypothetical protein RF11_14012 [Thelohanellus kitauei]|uniref:Uncharacterized protein n=1 Tax=Thelohanellus kitauei TaxID=669202 RepID=A0A0C2M6E7_THEKT|nr:hypothetical protein RF11_14012 [Thelohanellus kitauei]